MEEYSPSRKRSAITMADQWTKRIVLLSQFRPALSIGHVRVVREMTEVLAQQYVKDHPEGPLGPQDAAMIGAAATFYDVGCLGIPDEILQKGRWQEGSGRDTFLRHTNLGREIFQPTASKHPFLRYCGEIAYWHHKNYDGTGYPCTDGPVDIPLSGQLARAALRLSTYSRRYLDLPDCFVRTLEAVLEEEGTILSPEICKTVKHAYPQWEVLMRMHYLR